jgi:hypothetical protein
LSSSNAGNGGQTGQRRNKMHDGRCDVKCQWCR